MFINQKTNKAGKSDNSPGIKTQTAILEFNQIHPEVGVY